MKEKNIVKAVLKYDFKCEPDSEEEKIQANISERIFAILEALANNQERPFIWPHALRNY